MLSVFSSVFSLYKYILCCSCSALCLSVYTLSYNLTSQGKLKQVSKSAPRLDRPPTSSPIIFASFFVFLLSFAYLLLLSSFSLSPSNTDGSRLIKTNTYLKRKRSLHTMITMRLKRTQHCFRLPVLRRAKPKGAPRRAGLSFSNCSFLKNVIKFLILLGRIVGSFFSRKKRRIILTS